MAVVVVVEKATVVMVGAQVAVTMEGVRKGVEAREAGAERVAAAAGEGKVVVADGEWQQGGMIEGGKAGVVVETMEVTLLAGVGEHTHPADVERE